MSSRQATIKVAEKPRRRAVSAPLSTGLWTIGEASVRTVREPRTSLCTGEIRCTGEIQDCRLSSCWVRSAKTPTRLQLVLLQSMIEFTQDHQISVWPSSSVTRLAARNAPS